MSANERTVRKHLPMSQLCSISPQFLVSDLQASIDYYVDKLGFEQSIAYEDFYASVAKDSAEIHLKHSAPLQEERDNRLNHGHIDAYITVSNLPAYFDFCVKNGANITQGIETHPWDVTDFCVADPDGYFICFAQADVGSGNAATDD